MCPLLTFIYQARPLYPLRSIRQAQPFDFILASSPSSLFEKNQFRHACYSPVRMPVIPFKPLIFHNTFQTGGDNSSIHRAAYPARNYNNRKYTVQTPTIKRFFSIEHTHVKQVVGKPRQAPLTFALRYSSPPIQASNTPIYPSSTTLVPKGGIRSSESALLLRIHIIEFSLLPGSITFGSAKP